MGDQIQPDPNFRVTHTPRPASDFFPNVPADNYPIGTEVVLTTDNQTRFRVADSQKDGKYWMRVPWTQGT